MSNSKTFPVKESKFKRLTGSSLFNSPASSTFGFDQYKDPFRNSLSSHSTKLDRSSSSSTSSSSNSSGSSSSSASSSAVSSKQLPNSMFGKFSTPFIDEEEKSEEELCGACNEALSLRLAGEKTIVPVCGHLLHAACYEAIYGPILPPGRDRKPVGLCGVCRADMVISEETFSSSGSNKNKFATMAGISQPDAPDNFKMKSVSRQTLDLNSPLAPIESFEDDKLYSLNSNATFPTSVALDRGQGSFNSIKRGNNLAAKTRSETGSSSEGWAVVRPIIKVQAEYPTISRSLEEETKGHLTCMVTIKMPGRWTSSSINSPQISQSHSEISDPFTSSKQNRQSTRSYSTAMSPRPSSPTGSEFSNQTYGSTTVTPSNPFLSVVEDLHKRISDWKGHGGQSALPSDLPPDFGLLKLYDYVNIRKGAKEHEFLVYLFEDAILCITDDRRTGKLDSNGKPSDRLRLKGRIYTRHINSVVDSSGVDSLSLTINMQDEGLDQFIIVFKDTHSLNVWKRQIELLVESHHSFPSPPAVTSHNRSRFGMVSSPSAGSINSDFSYNSTTQPLSSSLLRERSSSSQPGPSTIREEKSIELRRFNSASSPPSSVYSNPTFSVPASPLNHKDFTPLDLMLVLSTGQTTLQLNILKNTLEFLLLAVGPKTRMSIVSFATGQNSLRKTPFIAIGTEQGRNRLEEIIRTFGQNSSSAMIDHVEESVNVVSAMNCALDIILGRKTKSSITGIILMNDGIDVMQKVSMDLVLTRAEAAKLPIDSIGWGRMVDPASLWLLSNHTGGSHTFVREFYELRDVMAGLVGGMLSIAATNVNLHISVPEKKWFKIRKVSGASGTSSGSLAALVSSEGFNVHIPIGELRYGETKELLIELEMSIERPSPPVVKENNTHFSSATDEFFLRSVGIDLMSLETSNFYEQGYADMASDVPLFEVECSYRDPAANKKISRVNPTPTLLTVTLNPTSTTKPVSNSNPSIVRRRMELLTADMLTRTLLFMSRRNEAQAQRLLTETKRIISTIAATVAPNRSRQVNQEELEAYNVLLACAEDVSIILKNISNREEFDEGNWKSFAAQQAVVLRNQKSWSNRTKTESLKWRADQSKIIVGESKNWMSSRA